MKFSAEHYKKGSSVFGAVACSIHVIALKNIIPQKLGQLSHHRLRLRWLFWVLGTASLFWVYLRSNGGTRLEKGPLALLYPPLAWIPVPEDAEAPAEEQQVTSDSQGLADLALTQAALRMVAATRQHEREELFDVFKSIDVEGDGWISYEKLWR